jgi:hypothetical protein
VFPEYTDVTCDHQMGEAELVAKPGTLNGLTNGEGTDGKVVSISY